MPVRFKNAPLTLAAASMLVLAGCQTTPPGASGPKQYIRLVPPPPPKRKAARVAPKPLPECKQAGPDLTQQRKAELFRKFTEQYDPAAETVLSAGTVPPPPPEKTDEGPCRPPDR